MGTLLCLLAHPGEGIDTLSQCLLKVVHEREHTFLSFGREVTLDIDFTESFAEDALYDADAPSPAGVHLLTTAQLLAEEVKLSLLKGFAQRRSSTAHRAGDKEVLEVG